MWHSGVDVASARLTATMRAGGTRLNWCRQMRLHAHVLVAKLQRTNGSRVTHMACAIRAEIDYELMPARKVLIVSVDTRIDKSKNKDWELLAGTKNFTAVLCRLEVGFARSTWKMIYRSMSNRRRNRQTDESFLAWEYRKRSAEIRNFLPRISL